MNYLNAQKQTKSHIVIVIKGVCKLVYKPGNNITYK